MPIVQVTTAPPAPPAAPATDESAAILATLQDKDGKLTLNGQVVESFIRDCDFDGILADPDVAECCETATTVAYVHPENGIAVEIGADELKVIETAANEAFEKKEKEDKEKKEKDGKDKKDDDKKDDDDEDDDEEDDDEECESVREITVTAMEGEVAAELVDEDDLAFMYLHYVRALPESTLVEKATKGDAVRCLGLSEEELVEFKKGDFAKIRRSAQGKNRVTRMLMAMLAKQVIARAAAGKPKYKAPGSTSGGTYTKFGQKGVKDALNPNGTAAGGSGTPAGKKKYLTYIGGHAAQSAAGEVKSGDKTKKSAAEIAKSAKAKVSGGSKFVVGMKSDKKTAKAAAIVKKKPGEKGLKQRLVASVEAPGSNVNESIDPATGKPKAAPVKPEGEHAGRKLHEGAALSASLLKSMPQVRRLNG